MEDNQVKIDLVLKVDIEEWWSNIFGCAYEQLPWWYGEEFHDGASWEVPGDVTLTAESPFEATDEDDSEVKLITKRFTVEDIRVAFGNALYNNYDLLDFDSYDCYSGDKVLQYAMYGELVFG